jgi:hypothetical protein
MTREEMKVVLDWCETQIEEVQSPELRAEIARLRDAILAYGLEDDQRAVKLAGRMTGIAHL